MGRWERFRYSASEFWETIGFPLAMTVYFLASIAVCVMVAVWLSS